jgi:N-acetylneuraminic acid mutarotase
MSKFIPTFILSLVLLISSVFSESQAQSWTSLDSYNGDIRHHPITFSNDRYGFVMAGNNNFGEYLDDVHRYDSQTNTWEQLADFPGGPRGFAYAVSDEQFAYVGFGSYGSEFPTDWWRYEFANNEWTALANFPLGGRNHPALILADDKIYMGLGSNYMGNLGDWWQYDIITDSWTEKAEFENGNRHHPFYFGVNGIAYVGFGHGNNINGTINVYKDFYKYDASNDSWITLNDFPGEGRVAGTQFSLNGKGYILSGDGDNHGPLNSGEFWEYTPETDSWTPLESHPGGARWALGSFVINCDVYLTSGLNRVTDIYFNDLMKYQTDLECGCNDSTAINYNPEADINDGSCTYCETNLLTLVISGEDAPEGLAWNIIAIGDDSPTATGGAQSTNICLEYDCYVFEMYDNSDDGWNGNNYEIIDNLGNIIASGTHQIGVTNVDTIEIGEMECYAESYRCNGLQACIDPMDGSGEYSSLNECESNCMTTTQIDDFSNAFTIFPNPSTGLIKIQLNYEKNQTNLSVFNTLGKLVYKQESLTKGTNTLDLSSESEGIYFLKISSNNYTITNKISINR